jgi:hypothetical protein
MASETPVNDPYQAPVGSVWSTMPIAQPAMSGRKMGSSAIALNAISPSLLGIFVKSNHGFVRFLWR